MALGLAWNTARAGLSVASEQLTLVSRNVSAAQDPNATRKVAEVTARSTGDVRLGDIQRVASEPLLEALISANSDAEANKAMLEALEKLSGVIGDPQLAMSPAALMAKLEAGLRTYAARPMDTNVGRTVIAAADTLAGALRSGAETVAKVRNDADRSIAGSVGNINRLLADLEVVNNRIVGSTGSRIDATADLDRRDAILKELSTEIGIRVVPRHDADVLVYTDSGLVLFETVARNVEFSGSGILASTGAGAAVRIDGVAATGSGAVMPLATGRLAGLVALRDQAAVSFGVQLDELARGLVEAFSDPDRSGGGGPHLPGLFTWAGGAVPASGTHVPGLAATLTTNAAVDPGRGGDLRLLRDGGASAPANPAYNANPSGAAGFFARLDELVAGLSATRSFDTVAGLDSAASLMSYASSSAGWIEAARSASSEAAEARDILRSRAAEALSAVTGVDIDREMTDMLQLERAYQASSRLIATVDQLFEQLFSAVRT